MNRQAMTQTNTGGAAALPIGGLLQRACVCGQHANGGTCEECGKKRLEQGNTPGKALQRKATEPRAPGAVPPIVHDVLRSPGEPLDAGTRAFFEPRFGRDFSGVRVHTDGRAAESASAVNALAYTVGQNIVFGAGRFAPGNHDGRRLIAHELTHVVQQRSWPQLSMGKLSLSHTSDASEREAERTAVEVVSAGSVQPILSEAKSLQRADGGSSGSGASTTGGSAGSGTGTGSGSSGGSAPALSCSLTHLDTECGNAAATCAAIQSSYCQKKFPNPADTEALLKSAVGGANSYKSKYPNAAANLLHYLDGTGTEKVMPVALFKDHKATKDKLENEHRDKFKEGGEKRLVDGRLQAGGGQIGMVWTGTASAFSSSFDDLGLAVGGYTLCSKVKVSATQKPDGSVQMTFDEWVVQAFDCYNWDPGKGIGIPGADDNDLCCLENAGKAKHFRVRTDSWPNDDAAAAAPLTLGTAGGGGSSGGGGRKR